MESYRAITPLLFALFVGACTAPHFDAASESRVILQRDAEWAGAATQGKDIEKIVSYWSDDAVVIPQGQPIAEGKEAIRAFVIESLKTPGFKIHWESKSVSFSPDGKLAYMMSDNVVTVSGADGLPVTIPGRAVTVWKKEQNGLWHCVVDIWNDPPKSDAKE